MSEMSGGRDLGHMENLLYDSGVFFESYSDRTRPRNFYRTPLFNFVIPLYILVIKSNSHRVENDVYRMMLFGDIEFYFDTFGNMMNAIFSLFSLSIMGFLSLSYHNHKRGITPTFLHIFKLLAEGKQAELKLNGIRMRRLTLICYYCTKILQFIPYFFFLHVLLVHSSIFWYLNFSFIEFVCFASTGIISTFLFGIVFNNVLLHLIFHFVVLVIYIHYRLLQFVGQLRRSIYCQILFYNEFYALISDYNTLATEVISYNKTFWSKFLFINWLSFGSCVAAFVYITQDVILPPFLLLTMYLAAIFTASLFLILISFACKLPYANRVLLKFTQSFYAHQVSIFSRNLRTHRVLRLSFAVSISIRLILFLEIFFIIFLFHRLICSNQT